MATKKKSVLVERTRIRTFEGGNWNDPKSGQTRYVHPVSRANGWLAAFDYAQGRILSVELKVVPKPLTDGKGQPQGGAWEKVIVVYTTTNDIGGDADEPEAKGE